MSRFAIGAFAVGLFMFIIACGSESSTQGVISATSGPASNDTATNTPPTVAIATAPPEATEVPTEEPTKKPEASPLKLLKQGYGQKGQQLGYAFLIENSNANIIFVRSQYQISLYGEDGKVLKAESGYIDFVAPGQTLGVAGSAYMDNETAVTKMELQILPGDTETVGSPQGAFEVKEASFAADEYFAKVKGIISSTYPKTATNVRISAIAYNEADEIIGGGFTFQEFVPANGETATEISVVVAVDPVRVELHPSFSTLTEMK